MQVGVGPQHREFRKEIQQTMQVGVGPQHREFRKEIQQTMQVGVGPQQRENGFPISTDNAIYV
ncbi:hypothetical protein I6D55_09595 [Staphylococcus aureus]|nr:hypothetical protein [Staphylococcus aureus]MBH4704783.1 hypothetical protein [Staphylococcus aureus]MBH4710018.1 hypothetical protein [Staphylococcus aureus]